MSQKPLLYSYFRSSTSWRVRIALAHKGIEYDYSPIHLINNGGDQHKPEYAVLNGMEQVPTLIIDGLTLNQSVPIIEYLDETRPEKPLMPKDPVKRQQVRHIAEIINSGIQPLANPSVIQRVGELTDDVKKMEWVRSWISFGLKALEKVLSKTAGKFCVGDELTLADCCVYPQVFQAERFGVDTTPYPIMKRIYEDCKKLDCFKKADFSRQPDTPPEMRQP